MLFSLDFGRSAQHRLIHAKSEAVSLPYPIRTAMRRSGRGSIQAVDDCDCLLLSTARGICRTAEAEHLLRQGPYRADAEWALCGRAVPSRHTHTITSTFAGNGTVVDMKAGEAYYVRLGMTRPALFHGARGEVTQVEPGQGKFEVAQLKPAEPEDTKAEEPAE
jgi:hypothetical protein